MKVFISEADKTDKDKVLTEEAVDDEVEMAKIFHPTIIQKHDTNGPGRDINSQGLQIGLEAELPLNITFSSKNAPSQHDQPSCSPINLKYEKNSHCNENLAENNSENP